MDLSESLHPSVQEFKIFINKHPKLIKQVRGNPSTLQEMYEKWALLGEKDSYWDKYKEQDKESTKIQTDMFPKIIHYVSTLDTKKIDQYISQFQQMLNLLQLFLSDQEEDKNSPRDFFRLK